jgi:hypothetical protein
MKEKIENRRIAQTEQFNVENTSYAKRRFTIENRLKSR